MSGNTQGIFFRSQATNGNVQIPALDHAKQLLGSGTFKLEANSAKSVTVPAGSQIAIFQPLAGDEVWWNPTSTAAVPTADEIAANPTMRLPEIEVVETRAEKIISLFCTAEVYVTIRFFGNV